MIYFVCDQFFVFELLVNFLLLEFKSDDKK